MSYDKKLIPVVDLNNDLNIIKDFPPRHPLKSSISAKKSSINVNQTVNPQKSQYNRKQEISKEEIMRELGVENCAKSMRFSNQKSAENQDQLVDSLLHDLENKVEKIRIKRQMYIEKQGHQEEVVQVQRPSSSNVYQNFKDQSQSFFPGSHVKNISETQSGYMDPLYQNHDRMQYIQHEMDNLNTLTIENVEAQLQAQRMRLKEVEEMYWHKKKMKNSQSQAALSRQTNQQLSEIMLQRKKNYHQQIQDIELPRAETIRISLQNKEEPQINEQQRKLIQYKNEQNLRQEAEKNLEYLNRKEFDKYKQPLGGDYTTVRMKSSKGFEQQEVDKNLTISHQPKSEENYNLQENTMKQSFLQNKTVDNKVQELYNKVLKDAIENKDQKKQKDENFILKYLYMEIDKKGTGIISKQEAYDFIMKDKNVLILFDLIKDRLYEDIHRFETNRKDLLDVDEFGKFLRKMRDVHQKQKLKMGENKNPKKMDILDHELNLGEIIRKDTQVQNVQYDFDRGDCVLSDEILDVMRNIFNELDRYQDYIVLRIQFINKLRQNIKIIQSLELPAAEVPIIKKKVALSDILDGIQNDYEKDQSSHKAAKEYISWSQFFEYFKNCISDNFIDQNNVSVKPIKQSDDIESKLCIQQEHLILLQDVFDFQPRIQGQYVATADFVLGCKKDPQIKAISLSRARQYFEDGIKQEEKIGEFIDRLLEQAQEYILWSEVEMFLTTRGYPLNYELAGENQQINNLEKFHQKLNQPIKQVMIAQNDDIVVQEKAQKLKHPHQLQILDEFITNNDDINEEDDYEQEQDQDKKNMISYKNYGKKVRPVTQPKPFSFLNRDKKVSIAQKKVNEMIEAVKKEEEDALNYKIKPIEIPLSTKIPQYNSLLQKEKEKKQLAEQRAQKINKSQKEEVYIDNMKQKKQTNSSGFIANSLPGFYKEQKEIKQSKSDKQVTQIKMPGGMEDRDKLRNDKELIKKQEVIYFKVREQQEVAKRKIEKQKRIEYEKKRLESQGIVKKEEEKKDTFGKLSQGYTPYQQQKNFDWMDEDNQRKIANDKKKSLLQSINDMTNTQKSLNDREEPSEQQENTNTSKQKKSQIDDVIKISNNNNETSQILKQLKLEKAAKEKEERIKREEEAERKRIQKQKEKDEYIQQLNELQQKKINEKEQAIKQKQKSTQQTSLSQQQIQELKQKQLEESLEFKKKLQLMQEKVNNKPTLMSEKQIGSKVLDKYKNMRKVELNQNKQSNNDQENYNQIDNNNQILDEQNSNDNEINFNNNEQYNDNEQFNDNEQQNDNEQYNNNEQNYDNEQNDNNEQINYNEQDNNEEYQNNDQDNNEQNNNEQNDDVQNHDNEYDNNEEYQNNEEYKNNEEQQNNEEYNNNEQINYNQKNDDNEEKNYDDDDFEV